MNVGEPGTHCLHGLPAWCRKASSARGGEIIWEKSNLIVEEEIIWEKSNLIFEEEII
jgi:hypothetical protein